MNAPTGSLRDLTSAVPVDVHPASGRLLSVAELQQLVHGKLPIPNGNLPGAIEVSVHAAHPGAGASTVALAMAVSAQRPVHLIEWCTPDRSALAGASTCELGRVGRGGGWQRGRRGQVLIDRPTPGCVEPCRAETNGVDLRIDDRGLDLAAAADVAIVVGRATVPGFRHVELALGQLTGQVSAVAAIGPSRWSGIVTSSLGPRLLALRETGRVVTVPLDRRLVVAGLSGAALPWQILHAAGELVANVQNDAAGTTSQASAGPS